jgi:selenide,water dikinase
MSPADISRLVDQLPETNDPNVLVGYRTADDAGVYRLDDDRALVQTLDFFPPVLDDPYDFGCVAAANSLSDAYAMGGRPITALAIAIVPSGPEWVDILGTITRGMTDTCVGDGVALLGGHTMIGKEPVVGLSVTGLVDPALVTSNATAEPGDVLVLTKPLGSGILTTALMRGRLEDDRLEVLTRVMRTTNRRAAEAAARHGAHSATDVTGFGLLGHLNWMMRESGTTALVRAADVPLIPGTVEHQEGHISGGTRRNAAHAEPFTTWSGERDEEAFLRLVDAQTSGGLVVALPPPRAEAFLADLPAEQRAWAGIIGGVAPREDGVSIRIL